MKRLLIFAGILLNLFSAEAQSNENKNETAKIPIEDGTEVAISRLGNTRIVFKDGTIKKNCLIKEIKSDWIVYIKDKVLHDAMIEKIKRIDLDNGTQSIFFDTKNKALIKTNVKSGTSFWYE